MSACTYGPSDHGSNDRKSRSRGRGADFRGGGGRKSDVSKVEAWTLRRSDPDPGGVLLMPVDHLRRVSEMF